MRIIKNTKRSSTDSETRNILTPIASPRREDSFYTLVTCSSECCSPLKDCAGVDPYVVAPDFDRHVVHRTWRRSGNVLTGRLVNGSVARATELSSRRIPRNRAPKMGAFPVERNNPFGQAGEVKLAHPGNGSRSPSQSRSILPARILEPKPSTLRGQKRASPASADSARTSPPKTTSPSEGSCGVSALIGKFLFVLYPPR